jgi:hypothetical protein
LIILSESPSERSKLPPHPANAGYYLLCLPFERDVTSKRGWRSGEPPQRNCSAFAT